MISWLVIGQRLFRFVRIVNSPMIHGMIFKESIHCQARTWALKICKIVWITSGPGMSHTIDEPELLDFVSIHGVPLVYRVRMTTRNLAFHGTAGMVKICMIGTM